MPNRRTQRPPQKPTSSGEQSTSITADVAVAPVEVPDEHGALAISLLLVVIAMLALLVIAIAMSV